MRVLLIDGDPVIFRALVNNFKEVTLRTKKSTTFTHYLTDYSAALRYVKNYISNLEKHFNCKSIIFLSDFECNWRLLVMPSYKNNRREAFKINPAGRLELSKQVGYEYDSYYQRGFEADDSIGVFATNPFNKDEKIIVSIDKDFNSIPCTFYNPDTKKIIGISEEDADDYFYAQGLAGDRVDGYSGCKGIGIIRALKYIKDKKAYRKGKAVWESTTAKHRWHSVLSYYLKAGQSYSEALTNLRVARILRFPDYDISKHCIRLFEPELLNKSA